MTVRFKGQSEYQRSYKVLRCRSVSPQCGAALAGLRSDHMGVGREPGFQRRRRLGPAGATQSVGSLLRPVEPQNPLAEPHDQGTVAPADSSSPSAERKHPAMNPAPGSRVKLAPASNLDPPAEPRPAADPGPGPAGDPGPGPAGDPGPAADPEPGPAGDPGSSAQPRTAGNSMKPHPSKPDSQPQHSSSLTAAPDGQPPPANEVQHALRWRAGLRSGGQRSGEPRTEYYKQFRWKKPAPGTSPILTAEQCLHSSRSVPTVKETPFSVATEYQRSFQGLAPPTGSRPQKHLEHQRVPLFHIQMQNSKKRKEESEKMPRPHQLPPATFKNNILPPRSPGRHRMLTEYQSSFRSPLHRIPEGGGATDAGVPQVAALRQQALAYRRRAWGTNFSRGHLSQLLSEHNALWEPTDTSDSAADAGSTGPTSGRDPDSCGASCVEALDLAGSSSRRSSAVGSGEARHAGGSTPSDGPTRPGAPAEGTTAWRGDADEEEGRLPTPRLKIRPLQRTHHDVTTPATGCAMLVGRLTGAAAAPPPAHRQRCGTAVSTATGEEAAAVARREAWPEDNAAARPRSSVSPLPLQQPASSPASKPIGTKHTSTSPVAPPRLAPPPQHCIRGRLRHADFQHNGDLGLRFRELWCPGGGCGSDEDDRLSVMSWRSAASCSMASSVLERAQKRRRDFWGKS